VLPISPIFVSLIPFLIDSPSYYVIDSLLLLMYQSDICQGYEITQILSRKIKLLSHLILSYLILYDAV